eukprot:scaffold2314_cov267-Pinguiococcus_pyrenoidosus.AAC.16
MLSILEIYTWEDLIRFDITVIWHVHEFMAKWPLTPSVDAVVSDSPFHDISLVTWTTCAAGFMEFGTCCKVCLGSKTSQLPPTSMSAGYDTLWVTIANLVVASALRRMLQAKRPVDFDRRLKPRTDRFAGSFGFPSLETHMAVVIFGDFVLRMRSWLALITLTPIFGALVLFIGFSRVYSCARFPHQILGSFLTGFVGLWTALEVVEYVPAFFPMRVIRPRHHMWGLLLVGLGVLTFLGLAVENGDVRSLPGISTPRQEFIRVLRGILGSGSHTKPREQHVDEAGYPEGYLPSGKPRSEEYDDNLLVARDETRRPKQAFEAKDSFYYLHRTLLNRTSRKGKAKAEVDQNYKNSESFIPFEYVGERVLPFPPLRPLAEEE